MVIDLTQVRRVLGVLSDNGVKQVHFQFGHDLDKKALTYRIDDDKVPNLRIKAVMYKDVAVSQCCIEWSSSMKMLVPLKVFGLVDAKACASPDCKSGPSG